MKKLFFFICLISLLISCNKISNKPFYEELTIDEVAKAMKQDSAFGWYYDGITSENWSEIMTNSQKAKYKELSHRRAFKYYKYSSDFEQKFKEDSIWGEEWKSTCINEIKQVDSIITYWKQYRSECYSEIDSYVKAEIKNVSIDYYDGWNYLTDRYEYSGHRVYDVVYTLFVPKIDEISYEVVWRNEYGKSNGWHPSGYDVNITKNNCTSHCSCAGVSENVPSEIWINRITIDGEVITSKYDEYKVPIKVREYLENERETQWEAVGAAYVDNFVTKSQYIRKKREQKIKELDELIYEFSYEEFDLF